MMTFLWNALIWTCIVIGALVLVAIVEVLLVGGLKWLLKRLIRRVTGMASDADPSRPHLDYPEHDRPANQAFVRGVRG